MDEKLFQAIFVFAIVSSNKTMVSLGKPVAIFKIAVARSGGVTRVLPSFNANLPEH